MLTYTLHEAICASGSSFHDFYEQLKRGGISYSHDNGKKYFTDEQINHLRKVLIPEALARPTLNLGVAARICCEQIGEEVESIFGAQYKANLEKDLRDWINKEHPSKIVLENIVKTLHMKIQTQKDTEGILNILLAAVPACQNYVHAMRASHG